MLARALTVNPWIVDIVGFSSIVCRIGKGEWEATTFLRFAYSVGKYEFGKSNYTIICNKFIKLEVVNIDDAFVQQLQHHFT